MENTLNLEWYRSRKADRESRVIVAKASLAAAQASLSGFAEDTRTELTKLIKEGKTTGDALHDECLCLFGLADEFNSKILEFDRKLKSNAGQNCLLIFRWRQQVRFGVIGNSSSDDYADCTGEVLGTLSGESLRIFSNTAKDHTSLAITFPFSRYVMQGFRTNTAQMKPQKSPLTLLFQYFDKAPNSESLLRAITETQGAGTQTCEVVFEGDERIFRHRLRNILDSATEEERIAASGI